jgi:hypothetical protein
VGISGEEGLQAVNSSDYAIAQVSANRDRVSQWVTLLPYSSDS